MVTFYSASQITRIDNHSRWFAEPLFKDEDVHSATERIKNACFVYHENINQSSAATFLKVLVEEIDMGIKLGSACTDLTKMIPSTINLFTKFTDDKNDKTVAFSHYLEQLVLFPEMFGLEDVNIDNLLKSIDSGNLVLLDLNLISLEAYHRLVLSESFLERFWTINSSIIRIMNPRMIDVVAEFSFNSDLLTGLRRKIAETGMIYGVHLYLAEGKPLPDKIFDTVYNSNNPLAEDALFSLVRILKSPKFPEVTLQSVETLLSDERFALEWFISARGIIKSNPVVLKYLAEPVQRAYFQRMFSDDEDMKQVYKNLPADWLARI